MNFLALLLLSFFPLTSATHAEIHSHQPKSLLGSDNELNLFVRYEYSMLLSLIDEPEKLKHIKVLNLVFDYLEMVPDLYFSLFMNPLIQATLQATDEKSLAVHIYTSHEDVFASISQEITQKSHKIQVVLLETQHFDDSSSLKEHMKTNPITPFTVYTLRSDKRNNSTTQLQSDQLNSATQLQSDQLNSATQLSSDQLNSATQLQSDQLNSATQLPSKLNSIYFLRETVALVVSFDKSPDFLLSFFMGSKKITKLYIYSVDETPTKLLDQLEQESSNLTDLVIHIYCNSNIFFHATFIEKLTVVENLVIKPLENGSVNSCTIWQPKSYPKSLRILDMTILRKLGHTDTSKLTNLRSLSLWYGRSNTCGFELGANLPGLCYIELLDCDLPDKITLSTIGAEECQSMEVNINKSIRQVKIESEKEIVLTELYSWDILESLPVHAKIKVKAISDDFIRYRSVNVTSKSNGIETFRCLFFELTRSPEKLEEYFGYFLQAIKALPSLKSATFVLPSELETSATDLVSLQTLTGYDVKITRETSDLSIMVLDKVIE
jgi:hypothetical protein